MAPATVNREVGSLRQVLNEVSDTFPGFVNPLLGLKHLRLPRTSRRALSKAEVVQVLRSLKTPEERLRFGLFVFTGMRRGEGAHLRWCSVDLAGGVLCIEPHDGWQTKNGEARVVPICLELEKILREAPRRSIYVLAKKDDRPFHAAGGRSLLHWMRRRYRRAGLADWQRLGVHTLRHTYCSRLAELGVRRELRAKVAGHLTLSQQDHYTHANPKEAVDAARKLRYS